MLTFTAVLLAGIASFATAQNGTVVTGALGDAQVVVGNPAGVTYVATLPAKSFFNPNDPRGNVKGSVSATSNPDGGATFQVSFSNLPTSGGPFTYHIHDAPVPADGNCTGTKAHQDPYVRGETPVCDAKSPETCQVGDLSGKHGKIESDPTTQTYTDKYVSLTPGSNAFFGNRSITFHFANKTRISCANFALASGNATQTGSNPAATSAIQVIGAGVKQGVPALSLMGALALAFAL
ncbi:uncharacterized protein BP5553_06118 [Venustampulla echinocandica]|uniref:superoxide dismutase n=1 Tax=Venustampulla echinocandica TaxID=2656787 RepID=A0A370TML3_9HELO|nr:uncharacterized protein BP5553_06118 [Venustampulla echinocandica]RDL36766.1 hypothetical protein BP5553_06118 [Venustampulla echinocandica]